MARRPLAMVLGSARALTGAALAAVLFLAGCSGKAETERASAATGPRAVPVEVSTAARRDVPVTVTGIGNVQPVSTVGVLSQINGQIMKVHFTEGQDVEQGQLLFTIDPRPFEATLEQTQATVARDRAGLSEAEASLVQRRAQVDQAVANLARDQAQLENARVQERRYRDLVEKEFVAREQYDQVKTNLDALVATVRADEAAVANAKASERAGQAQVENARAAIRADEAQVDSARLQLAYTKIRAPMSGRTGNLLIHEGNVVKANDFGNSLVSINVMHPIYVSFAVPEQHLVEIKRRRGEGTLRVEAVVPGAPERVQGDLAFLNNTVDPTSGTIQLKARFDNRDNALWPGQFVTVVLTLSVQRDAVVVPSQAIQTGQSGSYVFVVKPNLTAESRPVTVGRAVGRETVVERGLSPGERVVTDGQLRLAPGARVDIKKSVS